MANQINRRAMEQWLLRNGFTLQPGGRTAHKKYSKGSCIIVLSGHGPTDLTKKHVGMILRQLEQAGFTKETVRKELGGK